MTSNHTHVSTAQKIVALLTPSERRSAGVLLGLMVVGMLLETLGLGLVIPASALLLQRDVGAAYPRLRPVLDALGHPTQAQLITTGMLLLVGIYLVKAVFLGYLAWRQTRLSTASSSAGRMRRPSGSARRSGRPTAR